MSLAEHNGLTELRRQQSEWKKLRCLESEEHRSGEEGMIYRSVEKGPIDSAAKK